jgi:homoserine O-acetyltransferase/O-succinyltransferase
MPETIPPDSVGIVTPEIANFSAPVNLECGKTLERFQLVYETYGELNAERSNAILVCHALSGNHHAAGYHSPEDRKAGWWDSCIGPGKPVDTSKFFVVSLNNLGGCHGSTGPVTTNPATHKPYGPDFPIVTVTDWVTSQAMLADLLGIQCWAAVIGGSLGGMQALQWSIQYPERIRNAVIIASTPKLTTQNIAFNEVARRAISSDPEFHDGHYYEHQSYPANGLKLARMLGHITYLSDAGMGEKFGRDMLSKAFQFGIQNVEFEIESYLRYQGEQFSKSFDANTYLLMTRVLDYFDPARHHNNDLACALASATSRFFVVSFTSDWRFAPKRSEELVSALVEAKKSVSYAKIEAPHGHDAFLIPTPRYMDVFHAYMQRILQES